MKSKGKKRKFYIIAMAFIITAAGTFIIKSLPSGRPEINFSEIFPVSGDIRRTVSTTGTVAPKNRLEIMPSVAGRIDRILVKEGNHVRVGQVLALMSSTDRAALIDAARLQGAEQLRYWKEAYKPIQIVAPISGTVIVRDAEPGQTVTTSDAIIVISDRLIMKAQVDETDIGRVAVGQRAAMSLDSHPDIKVGGRVTHIYYESTTVSNVTIYYVIITPDRIPPEFRSGMSASVEIIEKEKKNVLMLPQEALINEGNHRYVMIKKGEKMRPEKREVSTGLSSEENVEITEGLTPEDTVLMFNQNAIPDKSTNFKTNPFMPQPRRRRNKK